MGSGNRVYLIRVSRVRIPLSPPKQKSTLGVLFCVANKGERDSKGTAGRRPAKNHPVNINIGTSAPGRLGRKLDLRVVAGLAGGKAERRQWREERGGSPVSKGAPGRPHGPTQRDLCELHDCPSRSGNPSLSAKAKKHPLGCFFVLLIRERGIRRERPAAGRQKTIQ